MRVVLADKAYEFVPWRPELGQVFVAPSGYAFQCATGQINEHHHWLLPPFVIGTAFDGMRGYFVQKNDVA